MVGQFMAGQFMVTGKNPKQKKPPVNRRRAAGLRAVGVVLPRIAAPAFAKRGFTEAAIVTDWAEIVGPDLAAHSAPERIVFPRGSSQSKIRGKSQGKSRGGTLRLRVAGGIAVELQHLEPEIIERINGYFGFLAVERLVLLQGLLPQRPPPPPRPHRTLGRALKESLETELSGVEDESLRNSLRALGVAVLGHGPDAEKAGEVEKGGLKKGWAKED
jgi:hypothetical protein